MEQPPVSPHVLRFGVFEVDVRAGEIRKSGLRIRLQEQPFRLLRMLLDPPGAVVTRDQIRQALWPGDTFVDFDHSLNNAVNRLRTALGDSADNPRFIETLSRHGYRFISPVEAAAPPRPLQPAPPRRRWMSIAAVTIAACVIAAAALGGTEWRRRIERAALTGHAHPATAASVNAQAYEKYLEGRFHALRENRQDNDAAIALLTQAVEIDPSFAAAFAELARTYAVRWSYLTPQEPVWQEKAFVAVEKALALAPDLPEAHLTRGMLLWTHANHFPHDQAAQEFRRALAVKPNLDEAHHQLALIYLHIGLLDKALQEAREAVAINPSHTLARYRIGVILHHQQHYEEALTILRTIPKEFNPALVTRQTAWTLFSLGRRDEAAALIAESLKNDATDQGGQLASAQAMLLAAAGAEREAEAKIAQAAAQRKGFMHFHHTAYNIGVAYALLHRPDSAVRWLRDAAMDGYPCYPLFEKDASLNTLRTDPRFMQLMAEVRAQWAYSARTIR